MDFTFAEGSTNYSFQAPELDSSKVPAVYDKEWDFSSTNEYVIGPYAYYDESLDTLAYLGFVTHDSSSNCHCPNSDLTASGAVTFSNLTISNFETTTVEIQTTSIINTVDTETGV